MPVSLPRQWPTTRPESRERLLKVTTRILKTIVEHILRAPARQVRAEGRGRPQELVRQGARDHCHDEGGQGDEEGHAPGSAAFDERSASVSPIKE